MSRKRKRNASFAEANTADNRKNLPAQARGMIANARNDITIPYYSGVMQYVDDMLIQRGAGKGLKIYDEIERDTHAGSVLDKRRKQLTAREWKVEAFSTAARDIAAADFVRSVFGELPFDRICEDLLDATLKGFAISEIVWKRDGAAIVPAEIRAHDQRRFMFDEDWRPRLLTMRNMMQGDELPDRKFIVHRYAVKGNNPYGIGLGSRLFWPVLFKREGIAFWLHFLDKFAGPTVVATSPYGALSDEQNRLLNILTQARTSSAIVAPVGSDVKFLEASRSGSVTYQHFLEYWDRQISICVCGETLTTDIGNSGSRAASETHADMLGLLVDSDADLLSGTLRDSLIRWLVDFNFPGAGLPKVWRERPSDAKAEAEVKKAEAEAAVAANAALRAVLTMVARIADDSQARLFMVASGVVKDFDDEVIDIIVELRASLIPPPMPDLVSPGAAAAAPPSALGAAVQRPPLPGAQR
ncbi:MAG TPA: hypothetical protein DEF16_03820 [Gemmobacter sp.]|nr:hypothetical protein [Gemmobacter sp.]HBU14058.1 hypothetical protein [Gemmobacter sp.]